MLSKFCDCGIQRPWAACCGPYLLGEDLAPTAEALMRSRYSAFCRGNIDYLMATHRAQQPETNERLNLAKSIKSTRWVNLLIVSTQKGKAKDKTGVVEFVAAYRPAPLPIAPLPIAPLQIAPLPIEKVPAIDPANRVMQMHERSQFVKEGDRWFYTVGDSLPTYKPKCTQPCWCGSGKKFQQCHA